MAHSSPAVLSSALDRLKAFFTPAHGRHSTAARRRRSTRVRRYAPAPAPASAKIGALAAPLPAPRLAPPAETIPAEGAALVRRYYRAFESERDMARVQAQARARLEHWTTKPAPAPARVPAPRPAPAGDLLAPADDLGELRDATRRWLDLHQHKAVAL